MIYSGMRPLLENTATNLESPSKPEAREEIASQVQDTEVDLTSAALPSESILERLGIYFRPEMAAGELTAIVRGEFKSDFLPSRYKHTVHPEAPHKINAHPGLSIATPGPSFGRLLTQLNRVLGCASHADVLPFHDQPAGDVSPYDHFSKFTNEIMCKSFQASLSERSHPMIDIPHSLSALGYLQEAWRHGDKVSLAILIAPPLKLHSQLGESMSTVLAMFSHMWRLGSSSRASTFGFDMTKALFRKPEHFESADPRNHTAKKISYHPLIPSRVSHEVTWARHATRAAIKK